MTEKQKNRLYVLCAKLEDTLRNLADYLPSAFPPSVGLILNPNLQWTTTTQPASLTYTVSLFDNHKLIHQTYMAKGCYSGLMEALKHAVCPTCLHPLIRKDEE